MRTQNAICNHIIVTSILDAYSVSAQSVCVCVCKFNLHKKPVKEVMLLSLILLLSVSYARIINRPSDDVDKKF